MSEFARRGVLSAAGVAAGGALSDCPATSAAKAIDWPDPILPMLRRYREIWAALSAISDAEDAVMMAERTRSALRQTSLRRGAGCSLRSSGSRRRR